MGKNSIGGWAQGKILGRLAFYTWVVELGNNLLVSHNMLESMFVIAKLSSSWLV